MARESLQSVLPSIIFSNPASDVYQQYHWYQQQTFAPPRLHETGVGLEWFEAEKLVGNVVRLLYRRIAPQEKFFKVLIYMDLLSRL